MLDGLKITQKTGPKSSACRVEWDMCSVYEGRKGTQNMKQP